ncbi:bifunctional diguanylate cyclase/phosphodiesterase [Angustibacter sp. Root456]|uniref:bifunctional diguanylate cyclase/phosphodiesterase n=1 Tax=Angustibacter sp. Root456 TaxID=1736539 RepID=UPI0006F96BFC|nr:bifunctional diguanylate cyclase/phosphodiesterase [Angustibacter sp. Root456]
MSRARHAAVGALLLAVAAYVVLPLGEGVRGWAYEAIGVTAVALGGWGVRQQRLPRRRGWLLVLSGFALWVVGDLVWDVEQLVLHLDLLPAPSDAVYIAGYVLLGAGVLVLARARRESGHRMALLDAAIVTVGVAVPTAVFLIVPAASDSTLTLAGQVTTSAYPLGDLFVLAVLARLALTPGASTPAFRWLVAGLLSTLVADIAYQVGTITGRFDDSVWMDLGWLLGYVAIGAAALHPSMRTLAEPPPDRAGAPSSRQLAVLTAASVLPGVTLLIEGFTGRTIAWGVIGAGIVVLAGLVLARMGTLLDQVQVQAVQLAALARVDSLTGAPNRRTWDHELSRACAQALDRAEPLALAIIDLDHFKRYNDAHGHQEGDRLLRGAVAAWSAELGERQMLARYGGEEFAVLLPGHDLVSGRELVDALRRLTPGGQTFSAGVAAWEPGTEPASAVAAADAALYRAKRSGRDRVEVADRPTADIATAVMRGMRIVVQPIRDAATGRVVGHEALTRFAEPGDVRERFAEAHALGFGDLLEAHAIRSAVALPQRPVDQLLFVNVSTDALTSERFWDALPERLDGVVVELVEDARAVDWSAHSGHLDRLRARGARLAVDDLGAGAGELARLLVVRPDVVKLDRHVTRGCADDDLRADLIAMIVGLADASGAQVCAEGVEAPADLERLQAVGVQLAQGFLLGHPEPTWAAPQPDPAPSR